MFIHTGLQFRIKLKLRLREAKELEVDQKEDIKIRLTILFEYYLRKYGKSKNPQIHFFKIPELKEIESQIIASNVIYLINKNFVRGGVDVERDRIFPWITRILPKGTTFVEQIIMQTLKIAEEDEKTMQDKALEFVVNNMKNEISDDIFEIAKRLF